LPAYPNIEIFKINQSSEVKPLSKSKIVKQAVKLIQYEILNGRHKIQHIIQAKKAMVEVMLAFQQANKLAFYIAERGFLQMVLYNYWLHRGVIVSYAFNTLTKKQWPIVSRAHAFDLYNEHWFKLMHEEHSKILFFNHFKINVCKEVYPISSHGNDFMVKFFPEFKKKLSVQRLGVLDHATALEQDTHQTDQRKITIVSCGTVNSRKRIYMIPQLIQKMKTQVSWIHFGGGEVEDMEMLRTFIQENNVAESCLLKGQTSHPEIIKFYTSNHVDLFINVSLVEGIPVALMEAASFGIPMLATDTVGNPEIVNNDNGILIPVDFDIDQVAALLDDFFVNKEVMRAKREMSRKMFLNNYSAKTNYTNFANRLKALQESE
jgi:glycosyltransferase involved in cell wall biosynthesis